MKANEQKHTAGLPTARKIRRACSNELYRTVKRMKVWIPKEKIEKAESIYYKKVIPNLIWIYENRSNRKLQADWWEENVSAEIAELWEVDRAALCAAFRDAYGG
ncbi:dehydrogenase [Paenibacillus arenilitoris]|uniref:Dehydrogenase n=1 Tax=Paenibacillus arenilitoris TaxID=2772299 RepID=A0A927H431_9BACL|nr:dehydrogenase [Paenibacillus arenilitoris]MBD2867976.1 dehydrogenase [Paenibacillus arenilitoris]